MVSKGVDIALATDVLSNAFAGNFDAAVLFAGDADYVPLVDQVKRLGRRVILASFSSRLSGELKLASDRCYVIDEVFEKAWQSHLQAIAPKPAFEE